MLYDYIRAPLRRGEPGEQGARPLESSSAADAFICLLM